MRAYIMLNVKPQDTAAVIQRLQGEPLIIEASLIHGPYDCVAHVESKDLQGINDTVMRIRSFEGVLDTMTCLVIQSWLRS